MYKLVKASSEVSDLSIEDIELKKAIIEEIDALEGDTAVDEVLDCLLDKWDIYVDADDLETRQ